MKFLQGLQAAMGLLTIIPVQSPGEFRSSLPFFPVVGLALGGIIALAAYVGGLLGWHLGGAIVGVGLVTLLTGAIHVDGLADAADACGVYGVEEKLRVMKDPHVGSFGVAAIVLVLLFKVAAIQALSSQGAYLLMVLPVMISRVSQVLVLVTLPYIRAEGKARVFSESARPWHAVWGAVCCLALGGWLLQWQSLGLFLVVGVVLAALWRAIKQVYGGITGDLVGAVSELVECAAWGVLVGYVVEHPWNQA